MHINIPWENELSRSWGDHCNHKFAYVHNCTYWSYWLYTYIYIFFFVFHVFPEGLGKLWKIERAVNCFFVEMGYDLPSREVTNISHLEKRRVIFKSGLVGCMSVPTWCPATRRFVVFFSGEGWGRMVGWGWSGLLGDVAWIWAMKAVVYLNSFSMKKQRSLPRLVPKNAP